MGNRAREIKALLDSGADPDAGRQPPLLLSARIGHVEVAQVLLGSGADVHDTHQTPLHAARGNSSTRSLLLSHGASDTPFSLLSSGDVAGVKQRLKREAVEIVQLLLKHGADPRHVNRTGKPVAASTTNAEILSLLGSR